MNTKTKPKFKLTLKTFSPDLSTFHDEIIECDTIWINKHREEETFHINLNFEGESFCSIVQEKGAINIT